MSALIRLARRNVRRQWRRLIVIMVLIALPVGLGVGVGAWVRTSVIPNSGYEQVDFGRAEALVYAPGSMLDRLESEGVPIAVETTFWTNYADRHTDDAEVREVEVSDLDLTSAITSGRVGVIDGDWPSAPGQVAMTRSMADTLGLRLGADWQPPDSSIVEVVAIVNERLYHTSTVWVPPGSLGSVFNDALAWEQVGSVFNDALGWEQVVHVADAPPWLVRAGNSNLAAEVGGAFEGYIRLRADLVSPENRPFMFADNGNGNPALWALSVTATLLVLAAVLAVAGFAVGVRRRVQEFGRLSSIGAVPAQVQRLVVAEAAMTAMVASVIGAVAGVVMVALGREWLYARVEPRRVPQPFDLHTLDVMLPVVAAVAATMLAAWLPAREASRLSVVGAIQGGSHRRRLPSWLWSAAIGLGLIGGVLVVGALRWLAFSEFAPGGVRLVVIAVGLALAVVGLALVIALVLQWIERRPPSGVSSTTRLALRMAGRHKLRSTAAVTGVALVLAVAVVGTVGSEPGPGLEGEHPAEAELAFFSGSEDMGGSHRPVVADLGAPDRLVDQSGSAVDQVPVGARIEATRLDVSTAIAPHDAAEAAAERDPRWWGGYSVLVVTDELAASGILPDRVVDALAEPGVAVALADAAGADTVTVTIEPWSIGDDPVDEQVLTLEQMLVPSVADLGFFVAVGAETAADGAHPMVEAGRFILPPEGQTAFAVDNLPAGTYGPLRYRPTARTYHTQLWALGAAAVSVVVLYRLLAGLLASELDEDVALMSAIGGPPRVRQRLAAAMTTIHVGLATLIGVPLALVAGWGALYADPRVLGSLRVPWLLVGGLALLPFVAALVVGATSRSTTPALSRRIS